MTDHPYTDADLHAEAARQHHELTRDPAFMGRDEMMPGGEPWDALDGDERVAAQSKIDDLLSNAANVSEWAIKLGAAGLTPHEPYAVYGTTAGWLTAVQVATPGDLTADARDELLPAIREAVEQTVCRVLWHKPVSPQR